MLYCGFRTCGVHSGYLCVKSKFAPCLYQGLSRQLMQTTDVENYPGYSDGILGPQMMEDFRKQAERMGADIRYGMITKVDFSQKPHRLWIDGEKEITADAVILSTGASAKWLGIPSEKRLNGSGVSACAVCDGFFYRNKDVAVVGGGDTACEEALYLSKICSHVHMLVRRDEMRASKVMQDRVLKADKITVHWNSETDEVLGEQVVEGMRVKNNKTGELTEIPIEGFFVAIGHKPNSDVFADFIDINTSCSSS